MKEIRIGKKYYIEDKKNKEKSTKEKKVTVEDMIIKVEECFLDDEYKK